MDLTIITDDHVPSNCAMVKHTSGGAVEVRVSQDPEVEALAALHPEVAMAIADHLDHLHHP